mmetsp:Transcript_12044/g.42955  ORF Transcript_12044/g.42955 Transcript_12044/m.42955 type:complete len:140 (+) Transcript_12044:406-825(+)
MADSCLELDTIMYIAGLSACKKSGEWVHERQLHHEKADGHVETCTFSYNAAASSGEGFGSEDGVTRGAPLHTEQQPNLLVTLTGIGEPHCSSLSLSLPFSPSHDMTLDAVQANTIADIAACSACRKTRKERGFHSSVVR